MTTDIIKRLREALAAGPTVGPWTMLPAGAGEQCVARINSWEAVPPNGVELAHDSIDANYIAAASPDNIAALLDRLDAAEAENERLREDAGRYRFIRDNPWPVVLSGVIQMQQNSKWDASIDAARREK